MYVCKEADAVSEGSGSVFDFHPRNQPQVRPPLGFSLYIILLVYVHHGGTNRLSSLCAFWYAMREEKQGSERHGR